MHLFHPIFHVHSRSLALAGGVVVGMASFLCVGCDRTPERPAPEAPPAREVVLVPVLTKPALRFIEITGTLFGEEEVLISAKVPGRIAAISADLGDQVASGATVAEIDPTDYTLAVDEQQASLQADLAKLGLDQIPTGEFDLAALPVVARAEAEARNAQARLDRARRLFERTPPLLSEQDYADIETQSQVAVTSAAVERLNAMSLVASARVSAAALEIARQRLADTTITAPRDPNLTYQVASRMVSVGELVSANQPLFRLVAVDRVKFRGQVPERFAPQIRADAAATLVADAYPEPFSATVSRISPAVDPQTRSFAIEILAANPERDLMPGSFVRAQIVTGLDENARFVPASAVSQFAGVTRLFSVREGKVVEHRVTLGPEVDATREVISGLGPVDQVIDRPRGLGAGVPVVVKP